MALHKSAGVDHIQGPHFVARLSSSDCRHGPVFSRRVLVFRTTSSSDDLTQVVFQASKLLVQKFPFLGGRCIKSSNPGPTGQSNWKELVPGPGISISSKILSKISYLELEQENFPPERLKHDELMPIPVKTDPEPYDVAHFQLNFIQGGLLLAICIAHVAADGVAQSEILRVFASYSKMASDSSEPHINVVGEPLGLDRSSLIGLRGSLNSAKDHPSMIQKHSGLNLTAETGFPEERVKIYRLTATKLQRLKTNVTSDMRISSNDAIMALMWRAIIQNRIAAGAVDPSSNTLVTLYIPISFRRALGLDDKYIGNAVCNRLVRQPLSELLSPLPGALQRTAALIRTEINSFDEELARGYMQLSDSAPSVTDFILSAFPTIKSTSIVISSFYHSNEGLMKEDWGDVLGNKLTRLRCTDAGYVAVIGGFNFVMPAEQGGAEVQVGCYPEGIEALEKDDAWKLYCDRS